MRGMLHLLLDMRISGTGNQLNSAISAKVIKYKLNMSEAAFYMNE